MNITSQQLPIDFFSVMALEISTFSRLTPPNYRTEKIPGLRFKRTMANRMSGVCLKANAQVAPHMDEVRPDHLLLAGTVFSNHVSGQQKP